MSEPSPLAAGTTPPPTLMVRSPLARVHAAAGADATAVQLGSPRGGTAASSEDAGSVPPSPTLRRLHGASHGDDLCALESAVSYKPLVAPSTPRALKHQAAAAAAAKGGLVRRPATLLFGASVVLLMVLGMAGSGVHLRLTKQEAMVGPTPRVSAASFDGEGQGRQARQPSNQEQQQQQAGQAQAEASGGGDSGQSSGGGGGDSEGDGGSSSSSGGGGLAALLSSAAATVASQLGVGGGARSSSASSSQQQQQQALGGTSDMPGASAAASGASTAGAGTAASLSDGDADTSVASGGAAVAAGGAAVVSDGGDDGAAAPEWRLRCAVMNNLVFHIDVMAGWTYAFQSAGCDVTVYQNERSLGIEDIMSTWLTGRFRKPELFPGEAGDFHIVILPTFRDQHAELVQYLLQLPRLKRQRYFLTQHNPDWLLNHPNVDILQQHLLLPLLAAGRAAQERAAEAAAAAAVDAPVAPKGGTDGGSDDGGGEDGGRKGKAKGGKGSKATAAATTTAAAIKSALPPPLQPPLLRVQIATLAPCVSNYTLFFLRDMAFNLTEGQTYSERVGSFRVRGGGLGAEGEERDSDKDNSAALRRWMTRVIDVDVPWLAPLVPWQPAWTSAAASSWAEGGGEGREGGGEGSSMGDEGNGDEALAGLLLGRRRRLLKKGGGAGGGGTAGGGGKAGASGAAAAAKGKPKQQQQQQQQPAKGKAAVAAAQRPPPPPPGPAKPGAGAAPPAPPPAPLGLEAIAMVRQLGLHSSGGEPRHVCIQGKLENSRRNYSAAFEALSHPAVLHRLRSSGERMLLLGHRSKWEQVVVPEAVADVVVVLASLPYSMFFDTLSRCRAILLAFATDEYYIKKSSSTIATAINVGVPLIAERRTLQAYGFLQPESCFVYDDEHAPAAPGAPAEPDVPPDDGGGTATAGDGTAAQGGDGDDGDGDQGNAHGDGAEASDIAGGGEVEAEGSDASAAGEAAAAAAANRRLLKAGSSRDERRQEQREEEEEWEEERQARSGKAQQLEEAEGTGGEVGLEERQEQEQQQEEQQQEEQQDAGQAGGSKADAVGGTAGATAYKDSGADASSEAAAVQDPPPGSYSAAILAALRSGSRAAIHEAVKQLKAEVMSHNTAVAAAFMAGTEGQYSAAERAQDAAHWQALLRERAAAGGKGSVGAGKGAA